MTSYSIAIIQFVSYQTLHHDFDLPFVVYDELYPEYFAFRAENDT